MESEYDELPHNFHLGRLENENYDLVCRWLNEQLWLYSENQNDAPEHLGALIDDTLNFRRHVIIDVDALAKDDINNRGYMAEIQNFPNEHWDPVCRFLLQQLQHYIDEGEYGKWNADCLKYLLKKRHAQLLQTC